MDKTAGGSALKGVLFVTTAVFLFAVADAMNKYLVERHPISLVQAGRYLVNVLLLLVIMLPRHGTGLWRTQRTGWVVMRGIILALATLTMSLALQRMPVGETVAIIYLAPIMVMLLSGPLLHEKVHPAAWFGALLAFGGVILVMRPGGGLDTWGVVFALLNAALGTAYHLMTRVLARTETTMSMLFHVALVGTVAFGATAVAALPSVLPTTTDLALIAAMGVIATAGHFLFTIAYREGPPALLAPVNYLHLVWAGLLGWLAFDHIPDTLSILGMALVLVAGVAVAVRAGRAD
ncbi:DMT family transporter [Pseudotabrizicola algicola]|uniref:DMT family transporter n=1 Tax=Pseudotabrizicola algicola TaxID=2709381 RepID=A0A6B3RR99_9RHOB|nr:DMT family transporter [Pseudotabrizicola algicola]NEX47676.1 DMT family transporter [Pseudotabrizicola algicola]